MKQMRKTLFLIFIILSTLRFTTLKAQDISVQSFSMAETDLSAKINGKKDFNDNPCALIKVSLPVANAKFEGNIVGDCEFKTNEYWVYMTSDSKKLIIKCPGVQSLYINFKEYGIDRLLEKYTYNLELLYKNPNSRMSINEYKAGMEEGERLYSHRDYTKAIEKFTSFKDKLLDLGEREFASSVQTRVNKCKRLIALGKLNGFEVSDISSGRYSFYDYNSLSDDSDKYGIIDSVGNLIYRPLFDEIQPYRDGVAWVRQGFNWGNISLEGAINVPIKYQMEVIEYNGNPSCVALSDRTQNGNGFTICDYVSGQPLLPNVFSSTKAGWYPSPSNFDYFCLHDKKKNHDYFIDKVSKSIRCDLGKLSHVYYLNYGLSQVQKNYAYGIVDSFGEIVLAPEYYINEITRCQYNEDEIVPLLAISSYKNYDENGVSIYNYKERSYINERSYHKIYRIWHQWIIVSFWDGKREFFGVVNKDTGEELINPYKSNIFEIIAPVTDNSYDDIPDVVLPAIDKGRNNTSTQENRCIIKYHNSTRQDYLNRDGKITNL